MRGGQLRAAPPGSFTHSQRLPGASKSVLGILECVLESDPLFLSL